MYSVTDLLTNIRQIAFNTDALMVAFGGANSLAPTVAYDFVEYLPPALPLVINYRSGGGGGAIVRQLTMTYVGTDVSTITRTI